MIKLIEHKDQSITLIEEDGTEHLIKPKTDLNKARACLAAFNNLKTQTGEPLYKAWQVDGYYLLPAIQEYLMWNFFVGLVQYQGLWQKISHKSYEYSAPANSTRRLERSLSAISLTHKSVERASFSIITKLARFVSRHESDVLLFDDGVDGFRFQFFKDILSKISRFTRVEHPMRDNVRRLFAHRNDFIIGGRHIRHRKNDIHCKIETAPLLSELMTQDELDRLLTHINMRFCDWELEYKTILETLERKPKKLLLCYDQIERIVPLVMSCHKLNIPVVSFQHGPITPYHAGWIGYDIPKDYCNIRADYLYCWGAYWKAFLAKESNKYDDEQLIVGGHLNKEMSESVMSEISSKVLKTDRLHILVPYEFIADNAEISDYIEAFLALGWTITIKIRPMGDGDLDADKFAYSEKVREAAHFAYDLTDEMIADIDVVIVTQSVFALEMMKYGMPIWYLDTSVTFLEQAYLDGFAHKVTRDDFDKLKDEKYLSSLLVATYSKEQREDVFSPKHLQPTLASIIEEHVNYDT